MIEGLLLIEGADADEEALRSVSLSNAKQLVVGRVPGGGAVLHLAATSGPDFNAALQKFALIKGVKGVLTLTMRAS
jgi:hypothetical protein